MPMLNVLIAAPAAPDLSRRVASTLSDLTARLLGKDPAVTAIAISYIAAENWFTGGAALSDQRKAAYWLDIKITEATNTKAEMADYIAAVHGTMAEILGAVHEESYVLVHPVPASAYGYGGLTQEYRFIAGKSAQAQRAA
ncbi:MAG: tautomerase family protein [Proteobacteria bacterium]|nr:tautomerase family protein [Pseudomonadota bacterium]